MSILSRPRLLSQERFDLEDYNALLSALRTDSKLWTKQFISGENYVVKGFAVSGIGLTSATISMNQATLVLPANTNDFSWFTAEPGASDITISDADLVDAARNYVELKLVNETNTPVVKAFWDPSANGGAGQEFNQQIDTMEDLALDYEVSQGGFSGSPDRIPLAIIDTDGSGNIKIILDRRPLLFRLGDPSDVDQEFSWISQEEPTYSLVLTSVTGTFTAGETIDIGGTETATVVTGGTTSITMRLPSGVNFSSGDTVTGQSSGATGTLDSMIESFTGADKDIDDFREALTALMTEIKRIKGTRFWYQTQLNSMEGISQFINSQIVQIGTNARYNWTGTELAITDDNGSPTDADVIAKIRLFGQSRNLDLTREDGNGGSSTIAVADGEVLFVKLPSSGDRAFDGSGSSDTNYQVADIASYIVSDETYWLAYREGSKLYVRGYGELDPGESAQIGDPISSEILSFIGAVDESDSDPNYSSTNIVTQGSSLVAAISDLDSATSGGTSRSNQDRTLKLVKGGAWNWDLSSNTLTWDASAFLQIAGLAENVNEISAGNAVLSADGEVAYVQAKRTAGASTLSVAVGSISSLTLTDDIVIIARRVGNDVLVGSSSFLLKDGEYLELDGALAELNRQLGQLKLRRHETDVDKARIDSSDVTLLDGNTLSRVIGDFLLAFDGAVIDFTTGSVFESDGSTPLGVNFTPQTIPVGEYFWYGVSLVPGSVGADNRQGAQVQVDMADSTNAVQGNAPNSIMSGDIKLGNIQVQNNGGNVEIVDLKRLGPGSGSGTGGGAGNANGFVETLKNRLNDSIFEAVTPYVAETDQDDASLIDASSTGAFDLVNSRFKLTNIGDTLVSANLLDATFLADEKGINSVEAVVKYDTDGLDIGATYEVSRNGGNEWQDMTSAMERVDDSFTFRGIHEFATEASNQTVDEYALGNADATEVLTNTVEKAAQEITVTNLSVIRDIELYLSKTGTPSGNYYVSIVNDDAGSPSTDPADILYETTLQPISGLSAGNNTVNFSAGFVLKPGTYHVVVSTDETYQGSYSAGVDEISVRTDASTPSIAAMETFASSTWSEVAGESMVYKIDGIELDLRLRVTSSVAGALIEGFGALYEENIGNLALATTVEGITKASFKAVADNTNSFTLPFLPNPDLLVVYLLGSGQSFRFGDFSLQGNTVVFPTDQFNNGGVEKTQTLIFDQIRGGAFDNSDKNAALLAANHLGSTDGSLDNSVAGRGVFLRRPDGTLRELVINNNDEIEIYSV